jgi:galactoside O-acetyltransferase
MNPFDPGYYSSLELRSFGFARVGENCTVARNCTIIGLANIVLGDHVRIDGFSSLIAPHGRIRIGSRVHIATGCMLGGRAGIELGDYSSLSQGVRLFTAIDDFSGKKLSNATVPPDYAGVQEAPIVVGRYVPIGSGSLVLPSVTIGEGAAVSAMSLINRSLDAWTIYAGIPVQPTGPRSQNLLGLIRQLETAEDEV